MITAQALADELGAELQGDSDAWQQPLTGVAPLDEARIDQLTFLASDKYRRHLSNCRATAILLKPEHLPGAPAGAALIAVPDPYLAYARVSHRFSRAPAPSGVIHPSAVVDATAILGEHVTIDANAVIGAGCSIGARCHIGAGCFVGERARLGPDTRLLPHVTVHHEVEIGQRCLIHTGAVIGDDGFGFAPSKQGWTKIAQLGSVQIGDDVEIGCNTTIDRGAINDTVVADGVIIDNLVMIAHNVEVGRGTAMAAQVGISGSTRIGAGCTFSGQVGVVGHLDIGDHSHFTGKSMVSKGTREPGAYSSGWPIQPDREWKRVVAHVRQIEKLERRVKALEQALAADRPK